jgi:hypothetical protein
MSNKNVKKIIPIFKAESLDVCIDNPKIDRYSNSIEFIIWLYIDSPRGASTPLTINK